MLAGRAPWCSKLDSGPAGSGVLPFTDELRGCCFLRDGIVRCLPTFMLIGFTKAASTAFYTYAQQHPQVRMARGKETSLLGLEHVSTSSLDQFEACPACERGEASPAYAWRDDSPRAAAHAWHLLGRSARSRLKVAPI